MEIINNIKQKTEHLIQQGYETDAGSYIRRGWEIFQDNMGLFVAYTLIMFLIGILSAFIPFGSLLVSGPLTAGFYIVANKISKGEPYEFGTFFKGFDFFVPLLLYSLISGIFMGDLGLYGLGRLSTVSSWVRGLLKRKKVITVRNWMAPRIWQMVLAARFIPGSRLPSYTASGVLGLSFWRFSLAAFFAVVLQTALLFTLVVYFGIHFREQLGIWRWFFAGGVIMVIILVSRKYRSKQLRSKQFEGRRPASEDGKET